MQKVIAWKPCTRTCSCTVVNVILCVVHRKQELYWLLKQNFCPFNPFASINWSLTLYSANDMFCFRRVCCKRQNTFITTTYLTLGLPLAVPPPRPPRPPRRATPEDKCCTAAITTRGRERGLISCSIPKKSRKARELACREFWELIEHRPQGTN